MAIQILGQDGVSVAGVDAYFKAQRVSVRPLQTLGWNSLGAKSGNATTVAANGSIFSFRNVSANPILIRRVGVGFVLTTAFTAAQMVEMALVFSRAFSASDTGGTAIAITGSNTKVRTSLDTPTSVDCRISTTAALTAGTKTKDTNFLAIQSAWCGAVGAGIAPSINNLWSQDAGDHPIVLNQNEGINIDNVIVMGAAGVGVFYVNLEFAEVTEY
jgi:hypothetical protein